MFNISNDIFDLTLKNLLRNKIMNKNYVMKLNNVNKIFGKGDTTVEAIKNVNFTVKSGEVIIVMGPSGAGKTTLLSVMGLLLRPTSGNIYFTNKILNHESKQQILTKTRRENIGFIFQSFNLIPSLNVIQNVEIMAKVGKIPKNFRSGYKQKCIEMLELFNMGHRLKADIKTLSGGELQRVAIARALINDPDVILADEPTGNLDSENGKIIGNYFRKIAIERNKSIIVATHDDRLRFCADRIIQMEDGVLNGVKSPTNNVILSKKAIVL